MCETKTCNVCNKEKPLSDFYFRKERNAYRNNCKKCKPLNNRKSVSERISKVCKHCGADKALSEYNFAGKGKWPQPYCKICDSERKKKWTRENDNVLRVKRKEYYNQNKEQILRKEKEKRDADPQAWRDKSKKWREVNPEAKKKRDDEYRLKNRDRINKYRISLYFKNHKENLEKRRQKRLNRTPEEVEAKKKYDREYKKNNPEKFRQYRIDNIEKIREQKRNWGNKKAATCVQYRLKRNLRTRIRCALKPSNAYKVDKSENLLGCTISFYKEYLESLFTDGMNWDKFMSGEIEIDHKKPCKLFDLTKDDEQRKCFHYLNTQPLWAIDNMKKGDRYDGV